MGEPGREREGGQGERREGQEGVRGSVGEEGEREREQGREGVQRRGAGRGTTGLMLRSAPRRAGGRRVPRRQEAKLPGVCWEDKGKIAQQKQTT